MSITDSDKRTGLLKKNIAYSFIIKGISIFVSLALVPATLGFLSGYEYGVWLTLSSVFTWINYFDIGLGNGLRNKLAEAFANHDNDLGQTLVSTTFVLLILITGLFLLLVVASFPFADWSDWLNIDNTLIRNINTIVILSFSFFGVNFILRISGIVFTAAQRPAINDLLTLLGNLLSLGFIILLKHLTSGDLLKAALALSAGPAIILLIAYPITFYKLFRKIRPSWRKVDFNYTGSLMNLGVKFFILQMAGLVIFGTSNLIISNLIGPNEVTPFNIAFRYFSIATMAFNIIITPVWSATTDAYTKGDVDWIKRIMKKMMIISSLSILAILLLILLSGPIYKIWIGDALSIPFRTTLWMGIYTAIVLWSTCFSTVLFGIGKLRLQMINTIIIAVLFIPLAILLCRKMGVEGMILTLMLTNVSGAILNPIQYYRVINQKASGIWNR